MSRTDAPGSSDSACPSDSVQVTAAAEGTSPAATPICCRLRDHRGSLGERQRLPAERLDQIDGALALDRVHAESLG